MHKNCLSEPDSTCPYPKYQDILYKLPGVEKAYNGSLGCSPLVSSDNGIHEVVCIEIRGLTAVQTSLIEGSFTEGMQVSINRLAIRSKTGELLNTALAPK